MLTLAERTAVGLGGLGVKGLGVGGAPRRINRLRRQNGWRSRWSGGAPDADEA